MHEQEIQVSCTWRGHTWVEIPEGMTKEEAIREVNSGLPDWAAEQINSATAELVDWES